MFVSNIDLNSEMRIELFEYLVLNENIDDVVQSIDDIDVILTKIDNEVFIKYYIKYHEEVDYSEEFCLYRNLAFTLEEFDKIFSTNRLLEVEVENFVKNQYREFDFKNLEDISKNLEIVKELTEEKFNNGTVTFENNKITLHQELSTRNLHTEALSEIVDSFKKERYGRQIFLDAEYYLKDIV